MERIILEIDTHEYTLKNKMDLLNQVVDIVVDINAIMLYDDADLEDAWIKILSRKERKLKRQIMKRHEMSRKEVESYVSSQFVEKFFN